MINITKDGHTEVEFNKTIDDWQNILTIATEHQKNNSALYSITIPIFHIDKLKYELNIYPIEKNNKTGMYLAFIDDNLFTNIETNLTINFSVNKIYHYKYSLTLNKSKKDWGPTNLDFNKESFLHISGTIVIHRLDYARFKNGIIIPHYPIFSNSIEKDIHKSIYTRDIKLDSNELLYIISTINFYHSKVSLYIKCDALEFNYPIIMGFRLSFYNNILNSWVDTAYHFKTFFKYADLGYNDISDFIGPHVPDTIKLKLHYDIYSIKNCDTIPEINTDILKLEPDILIDDNLDLSVEI